VSFNSKQEMAVVDRVNGHVLCHKPALLLVFGTFYVHLICRWNFSSILFGAVMSLIMIMSKVYAQVMDRRTCIFIFCFTYMNFDFTYINLDRKVLYLLFWTAKKYETFHYMQCELEQKI
jgi:hypothetical protein